MAAMPAQLAVESMRARWNVAAEASPSGERLGVHPDGLTRHATQVSLGDAEFCGHGAHVGPLQPGGSGDSDGVVGAHTRPEALADRPFEDGRRLPRVARVA